MPQWHACPAVPARYSFLQGGLLTSCWAVRICSSCLAAKVLLHAGSSRAGCPHGNLLPPHAAPCLQVRFEFDEPDFAMIDTLFSLAEAHLFMQLVELQDSDPRQLPAGKNTDDLYRQALAGVLMYADAASARPGSWLYLNMVDAVLDARFPHACCLPLRPGWSPSGV